MYYIILTIVEIWLFLAENWKQLTGTAIATGVGVIFGKRMGIRFTIRYFMKTFRLERKSADQQQLEHHEREIVRMGGIPWNVSMLQSERSVLDLKRLRLSLKGGSLARFVKFITPQWGIYQLIRRMISMNIFKNSLSKKLTVVIAVTLVTALNDKLGLMMSEETILAIAGLAAMYVAGQSHVDAKKEANKDSNQYH